MTVLDQRIGGSQPFDKKTTTKGDFEDGEDNAAANYQGVDDDEEVGTGNRV
jgi:hypothetical protein